MPINLIFTDLTELKQKYAFSLKAKGKVGRLRKALSSSISFALFNEIVRAPALPKSILPISTLFELGKKKRKKKCAFDSGI